MKRILNLALFGALLGAFACASLTGGAEKDATEAAREQTGGGPRYDVASPDDMIALAPTLDLGEEGFDDSTIGSTADAVAEGLVIIAFAALVSGGVLLLRRRPLLFSLLLSGAALLVALLTFLGAAA